MTVEKPKNNLPTVHSLALHRLSCSGDRGPFPAPGAICSPSAGSGRGNGSVSGVEWQSVRTFPNSVPRGSTLEITNGQSIVLCKSAKSLNFALQKPHGLHSNSHRKPLTSVYFHHSLKVFLSSVSTILCQVSLNLGTGLCFISSFSPSFPPPIFCRLTKPC